MKKDKISVLNTVKKLYVNGKSRKQAVKHVVGVGYSLAYAYRVTRLVYGRKFIRKDSKDFNKPVKRVEKPETSLYEFCLVPPVDLGVMANRYKKIYFMDAEV